jgi:aconitate hydratase
LKDIWPSQHEIQETIARALHKEMFAKEYSEVYAGDERWNGLEIPSGDTYAWDETSTYVKQPPYFVDMKPEPEAIEEIRGARVLALLGDSITTDHISPAGAIKADSPAGRYLQEHGVARKDFNSYGSRRGNHEVMMRGTFANVRLRNRLAPGTEGGFTTYLPDDEVMSIYDAAMKYQQDGTPLLVIAGIEYGTGSSRDWAAKGSLLLGIRAVLATSFERIHRSNLVGMGVAPLEFVDGESSESLGLTGKESYDIRGLAEGVESGFGADRTVTVTATAEDGSSQQFKARVRLDTPQEIQYYRHGGILHYVLRQLAVE